MFTIQGYEEMDDYKKSGLEGDAATMVKQSHSELADFQRLLIEKFGMEKKLEFHEILGRKLKIPPPRPMVLFDYDKEQVDQPIRMRLVCGVLHPM